MLATLSCPWREEEKKKAKKCEFRGCKVHQVALKVLVVFRENEEKLDFFFGLRGLHLLCQKDSRVFGTHKSVKQIVKM